MSSRTQASPLQRRVQDRYHWSGSLEGRGDGVDVQSTTTPTRVSGYVQRGSKLASTRTKTPPPGAGSRRPYPGGDSTLGLSRHSGGATLSTGNPSSAADSLRREALHIAASTRPSSQTAMDSSNPIADDAWMCSVLRRHLPPSISDHALRGGGEGHPEVVERRTTGATLVMPTAEPVADWVHTTPSRHQPVSDMVAVQVASAARTPRRATGGFGEADFREKQRTSQIEARRTRPSDDSMLFTGAINAAVAHNRQVTSTEHDMLRGQQVRVTGTSRHHSQPSTSHKDAMSLSTSSLPISLSPRVRPVSPTRRGSQGPVGGAVSASTSIQGVRLGSPRPDGRSSATRSPSSTFRRQTPPNFQPKAATPFVAVRRVLSSPSRAKSPTNTRPHPVAVGSPLLAGWVAEGTLINGATSRPADYYTTPSKTTTAGPRIHTVASSPAASTTPVRPYVQSSPRASPVRDGDPVLIPQKSVFDEERRLENQQVLAARRRVTVSKSREEDVLAKKRKLFGLDLHSTSSTPSTSMPPTTPHRSESRGASSSEAAHRAYSQSLPSAAHDPPLHDNDDVGYTVDDVQVPKGLEAAKRRQQAHLEAQKMVRHLEAIAEPSDRSYIEDCEVAAFEVFPLAEIRDYNTIQRALEIAAQRQETERLAKERWAEERRVDQRRSCWEQQAAMRTALEEQCDTYHTLMVRNFIVGVAMTECVVAPEVAVRELVWRREAQDRKRIGALRTLCETTLFKVAAGYQASTLHPATSPRRSRGGDVSTEEGSPPSASYRSAPTPTAHTLSLPTQPSTTEEPSHVTPPPAHQEESLGNLSGISVADVSGGGAPNDAVDQAMIIPGEDEPMDEASQHESINRSRGMTGADGAAADLFEVTPATSDDVLKRFLGQIETTKMGETLADQGKVRSTFHNRYHELITFEVCHEFAVMFGGVDVVSSAASVPATSSLSTPHFPSTRRLQKEYEGFREVAPTVGMFLPFEAVFTPNKPTTTSDSNTLSAEATQSMNAVTTSTCNVALERFVLAQVGRIVGTAINAIDTDKNNEDSLN